MVENRVSGRVLALVLFWNNSLKEFLFSKPVLNLGDVQLKFTNLKVKRIKA